MLKISRTAFGRLRWAAALALFASALAAISRPATETALRDVGVERSAERRTTDDGEVWESGGDFNGGVCVKTAKTGAWGSFGGFGAFGGLAKPGDR
ncbi:MAG: hypothetical protein IJY15_01605, partial [Thermoguttaceae bacterium]|nr:hypothetical protein [Thermoguttaceae bacterium]